MKFLVSNYATPWNTEPFYISAALSSVGVESKVFDPRSSIYDELDKFDPSVIVTHIGHISKSMLHYFLHVKKIQMLINVGEATIENIDALASSLKQNNIEAVFFGEKDLSIKSGTYIKVQQCADIFLQNGSRKYNIDKLIFVQNAEDIVDLDGSYHYTTNIDELSSVVDFILPIHVLNTLFCNYDEIIFKGGSYVGSELAFNAIYSGAKVIFDTNDAHNLEKINTIFKSGKLLSSVKNRHTCLHRVKSLLSQLNCKDITDKLEREIEKL